MTGTVLAVVTALAGGVGAALRFAVDGLVGRHRRGWFPLGTLLINVSGSFLLGLLTGLVLHHPGDATLKVVFGTGLAGGYTTFSTASVEAVNLATTDGRRSILAVAHVAGMLVLSMAAAALGMWWG